MTLPDGAIDSVDLEGLPSPVRERWPLALERANQKVSALVPNKAATRLLSASQRAASARQRVIWLHRAASAWAQPMEKVAACKKGCSHCCRIPLTISRIEAELIGKQIGVRPEAPAHAIVLDVRTDLEAAQRALSSASAAFDASACPFLIDDACSIYDIRPLACRVLLNLDDDDLLCRDVPGQTVPVPYANALQLKGLYLLAQLGTPMADIRAFFPRK